MGTTQYALPSTVDALPRISDALPADVWAADLVAGAETLLAAGTDVLTDGAGGLVVLGHAPMRALAENAVVGNAPLDFLLGRAADRVARTAGAAPTTPAHAFEHFLRNQVFTMNPPLHAGARRLVARHLMPRAVVGMRAAAEELAREVVERACGAGEVDLGRDLAAPYVTRFWTDQLGLPADHAVRVQELMHDMNRMFLVSPGPDDREALVRATAEYTDLVSAGVETARDGGGNALVGQLAADLAAADLDGGPEDLGALVAANFFDGFHTVGVALTNAAHLLLTHPEAYAQVRADLGLVGAVFTEGTRLAAPLMLTTRMALEPVQLDELQIPACTPVTMVWIAGNRDPRAVPDPTAYRLDRPSVPLTTFGGGARICPGRTAARMLAEVALTQLCRADLLVEPTGPDQGWVPGSGIRQLATRPVSVRRTGAA